MVKRGSSVEICLYLLTANVIHTSCGRIAESVGSGIYHGIWIGAMAGAAFGSGGGFALAQQELSHAVTLNSVVNSVSYVLVHPAGIAWLGALLGSGIGMVSGASYGLVRECIQRYAHSLQFFIE